MAIKEQDKVFYEELANGDKVINLPVTRANNVEGLGRSANTAYVVGDVVYVDNNKKVALKCITAGTTSNGELNVSGSSIGGTVTDGGVVWQVCNRTSDVTSVNGKTGDVVAGEVTDLSISGKIITVTFADGTTKTLTTQDTAPYSGSATSIGGASTTKPAVVVTTYRSGNNWYRVWSDGWIEQGGVVTGTSGNQNNQNNYQTVTLHKAFDNANYNVAFSLNIKGQSTAIDTFTQIWSITSNQFTVRLCDTGNTNTLTYTWYACGKGA